MQKSDFFKRWQAKNEIASNISSYRYLVEVSGKYHDFPQDLPEVIKNALIQHGITRLYSHQFEAWMEAKNGKNIVLTTGTSSGKSLCYLLPIFDSIISNQESRAMLFYPTKALTNDQGQNIQLLYDSISNKFHGLGNSKEIIGIYDGDTPGEKRTHARKQARLMLSNPDMLHIGVLPHHTLWQDFFRNLRYVVFDEVHFYRGVFGSHLANIIRRLKRICRFYGSHPQFILTSATIANPQQHAENLLEESVKVIDQDGSPHGEKHFLLYNPPLINADLGIRRGTLFETANICQDFIDADIQAIAFSRSRREVEILLRNLLENNEGKNSAIRGYRSGYLPKDRRDIESGLKNGDVRMVVATNALELGVDIGGMDAIIIVGYPGSISAVRQQSGRAGRRLDQSMAILIASANPLDQYLVAHPEFLFDNSPENALIDPDNLLILLEHLRCSAFELPFHQDEGFGNVNHTSLKELFTYLEETGEIFSQKDKYFWLADQYPASAISIRSASADTINIHVNQDDDMRSIGQIDFQSALWMVHPGAVYMQEGNSYLVEKLDLENKEASLIPFDLDYYTIPKIHSEITLINTLKSSIARGGIKNFGELLVSERVVGFKRIRWPTQEILSIESIDYLPATDLRTTGYWFILSDETVNHLRENGLWLSDPNNYGKEWPKIRQKVRNRDHFTCQSCGIIEGINEHHVHHKIPFKQFSDPGAANRLDNLVTLCSNCHMRAEMLYRIRSGLSGLRYVFSNIAPLFLMCDVSDLGSMSDPQCAFLEGKPANIIYDQIQGGIGLSKKIYESHHEIITATTELVERCACANGCPSCVGPSGPLSESGKKATLALLQLLTE